jgi:hypothetical protein
MAGTKWWKLLCGGVAVAAAGCGPWYTSIPTYWDPVDWDGPDERPWPSSKGPPKVARPELANDDDYVVPEDTPEECRAIFVVSAQNGLLAYKPQEDLFEERGVLRCPNTFGATPFSMAVSREGIAYVVFQSGHLYRVDTTDASCQATDFKPNQSPGFRRFGMGYAPDPSGPGEKMYVAEITFHSPSKGLATIDPKTNELSYIGKFSKNPGMALELTPTGAGPLYGYFLNYPGTGGTLVKIDTEDGRILETTPLDVGTNSSSLAVAWFNGYFFIFTSKRGGTEVSRYDPKKKETKVVATINQTIVGAGVSTCAPDRD